MERQNRSTEKRRPKTDRKPGANKKFGAKKRPALDRKPSGAGMPQVGKQMRSTMTKIYVGNLRYTKTEEDILDMFKKFGRVSYINIIMDNRTKQSKGIAFVHMPNPDCAQKAIKALNGTNAAGRTLKVSVAIENDIYKDRVLPRLAKANKETLDEKKPEKFSANQLKAKKAKNKKPKGLDALFTYLNA